MILLSDGFSQPIENDVQESMDDDGRKNRDRTKGYNQFRILFLPIWTQTAILFVNFLIEKIILK